MKIYIHNQTNVPNIEGIQNSSVNKIVAYHSSHIFPAADKTFPFSSVGQGIHCGTMQAAKARSQKTGGKHLYEFVFDKSNNAVETMDFGDSWEPGYVIHWLVFFGGVLSEDVWDRYSLVRQEYATQIGSAAARKALDDVLLSALKDANIPYFYYVNEVEDVGSVSYDIFDTSIITSRYIGEL